MISISRLLCDASGPGDHLRFRTSTSQNAPNNTNETPRPVVVWNCTKTCNLSCRHCYASATNIKSPSEMDTEAGKRFIASLIDFKVPVLLFSGGEPLLREDFFELSNFATTMGLRVALSTNGTLISDETARRLKKIGFAEVGISLDGIGEHNDYFRGRKGAFKLALSGIRNSVAHGLRVSLRLTMTRLNVKEIPAIFDLVEKEGINRICFYHLAYSGRGNNLREVDVSHPETRSAIDQICERTLDLYHRNLSKEVLTVDNHTDGVYLYLKTLTQDKEKADRILRLLKMNGGNSSGVRIGAVDEEGNVHPDQFWRHYSFGNVNKRNFGDIWADSSEPLLKGLRDRKPLLEGRCARCKYLDLCNGNLRERAEAVYGNVWAEDPACYLSDEEIGI